MADKKKKPILSGDKIGTSIIKRKRPEEDEDDKRTLKQKGMQ